MTKKYQVPLAILIVVGLTILPLSTATIVNPQTFKIDQYTDYNLTAGTYQTAERINGVWTIDGVQLGTTPTPTPTNSTGHTGIFSPQDLATLVVVVIVFGLFWVFVTVLKKRW